LEPGLEWHTVQLNGAEQLKSHAIILASGGLPCKLNIPGEDEFYGKGVSYCAVCDGFFFRNKVVAVVGGGDTAVEDALYLSKLAHKVYLVHRRDALRATVFCNNASRPTKKSKSFGTQSLLPSSRMQDRSAPLTCRTPRPKKQGSWPPMASSLVSVLIRITCWFPPVPR